MSEDDYTREWMKKDPYMLDVDGFLKFLAEKEKETLHFKEKMSVVNQTNLRIDLSDLINKQEWNVESGSRLIGILIQRPLLDWETRIEWFQGKHPFRGRCIPRRKLIRIGINPKNVYPFGQEFAIGTKPWISPRGERGYEYIMDTVVFMDANDLVRLIYLHEFSHVLDYLQGYRLQRKQTKANRFALRYFKELRT